jgi:hypothetical protein
MYRAPASTESLLRIVKTANAAKNTLVSSSKTSLRVTGTSGASIIHYRYAHRKKPFGSMSFSSEKPAAAKFVELAEMKDKTVTALYKSRHFDIDASGTGGAKRSASEKINDMVYVVQMDMTKIVCVNILLSMLGGKNGLSATIWM